MSKKTTGTGYYVFRRPDGSLYLIEQSLEYEFGCWASTDDYLEVFTEGQKSIWISGTESYDSFAAFAAAHPAADRTDIAGHDIGDELIGVYEMKHN